MVVKKLCTRLCYSKSFFLKLLNKTLFEVTRYYETWKDNSKTY